MTAEDEREAPAFLAGGGEAGALTRALDWSATPLGPPRSWPDALKTLTGLALASDQPMLIVWGPEHTTLYNDGYAAMCGARHPAALGRPFDELWADIWDQVEPILAAAYAGEAVHRDHISFVMHRNGYPEEAHFSFGYTPVRDGSGAVAGMFCACTEITGEVIAGREAAAAAAALKESEATLSAVLDALPVAVLIADPSGAVVRVNAATRELWGDAPKTAGLEDYGAWEGYRVDTGERLKGEDWALARALTKGEVVTGELVEGVRFGDGQRRMILNNAAPVRDAEGRIAAAVVAAMDVTERMAAETRLRLAAEAADIGIWDLDLTSGRLSWDARARALFGVEPDRPMSYEETFRAVLHPEDRRKVDTALRRALDPRRGGGEYEAEFRIRPLDGGTERWVSARGRTLFRDGRAVRFSGTVLDVTARKQDEERLRDASERMELAMEAGSVVGAWVWDMARDVLTADERFARTFGIDPEACARGVSLDAAVRGIHPDDQDRVAATIQASVDAGGLYRCEYRVRAVDGDWRWVEATGRAERGPNGEPRRFPGVVVGIDERKRAEARRAFMLELSDRLRAEPARAMRTAVDMLRAELGVSRLGYCDVADDGDTLRVLYESGDGSLAIQSGEHSIADYGEALSRTMARGAPVVIADVETHPLTAERAAAHRAAGVCSILSKPVVREGRLRACLYVNHAEPRDWTEDEVRLIEEVAERAWAVIEQARVAEAERQARAALRELADTLEQRVAERTAELMQAQEALRQSQKLEAMGQLTGGVAHDFNNLLTPIIGGLDMLQRRGAPTDPRLARILDGALASAERARTLVHRLLAFARRQPLQPTAVDVGRLFEGMADLLASTTGPRVKVVAEVEPGLPHANGDAHQLEMALLNLTVNARDAMPEGGTLTLRARAETVGLEDDSGLAPGPYVRLSVIDTGVGMDPATLERAVEPFFSTKGVGRGTGLGLSMVHGLAAQLGGTLEIESRAGAGTTVCLRLPVAETPAEAETSPEPAPAAPRFRRVLLVDDEKLVRASTAEMLSELGYTVTEAESGEEALARLQADPGLDVLVTDHLMPGMDGAALARAARRLRPELPVLVVSGYAEFDGLAWDLPRLTKPFRQADLAKALSALPAPRFTPA